MSVPAAHRLKERKSGWVFFHNGASHCGLETFLLEKIMTWETEWDCCTDR